VTLRRLAKSAIAHGIGWTRGLRSVRRLSGAAKQPLILAYHRVLTDLGEPAPRGVPSMAVSTRTLERHLDFVGRRFRFVSLDEMGARMEEGAAAGLAAITFDDGYSDFQENAFPLLRRKGIPAAVFVVTDLVESGSPFLHDRIFNALETALHEWGAARSGSFLARGGFDVPELPAEAFAATRLLIRRLDQASLTGICATLERELGAAPMAGRSLRWDELLPMSRAGLTVGSHTASHTLLTLESGERVAHESVVSRATIEARLGVPVAHFAYPDGSFDAAAVRAVAAAGYRFAYTGCKHRDASHPLLTLPRRMLWEGSTLGALGHFSADVLAAQIGGFFDLAERSAADHETAPARKRIAIVAPSLDVLGGQSVQAAALVRGLRQDGLEVAFVPTNPRFPARFEWLRSWPVARTLLNQALYLASLRRLRRAEVVHAFAASYWSFLLAPLPAMLAARAFGCRVVLNYHSGEAAAHLERWGALVHPWLRLAHEIVVPSEYLRQAFAAHGYAARVVRNVVDTTRYRYRERVPLRARLLSTRNFEPHYRVDVILDAFAIVKAARPEATLTLAGSGSEQARLRRRAEAIPGVSFRGRVAPESMPALYADADVFLNASVVDNQPLSLLEAFASGSPVVSTATGGIAAMLRHRETGLLVPPLAPGAMAAAVLELLRDGDLALRVARGARQVAESHAWACVRDQWAEVYAGRGVDAAPVDADGDRRAGRAEPAASREVAREKGRDEPSALRAG
jgi:glycosyltransferase involved in cell wall biosynthesis/peptidoglycan/xylan/chitin deacetylase (PgdA/CDA1 family)